MFRTVFARSLGIAFAAMLAAPFVSAEFAFAQEPPPVRIRSTIERIDGAVYVVKARDGAVRGTGEGHYPWDLQPQSTMTNANVEQVVSAVDGRTLTLKYKDGEKKIAVPANAPIVTYVPGDKTDIKPGAKVFIVAVKQADGTLQGRAWRIGRDGVTPPM